MLERLGCWRSARVQPTPKRTKIIAIFLHSKCLVQPNLNVENKSI